MNPFTELYQCIENAGTDGSVYGVEPRVAWTRRSVVSQVGNLMTAMAVVGYNTLGNVHRSSLRKLCTSCTLFAEKPKNLKGKKLSSQLWITRFVRDPYVEKARQERYRCRSAFKLREMNERYKFLKPGLVVIDCGAAPGSWTQVAVKETNADGEKDDVVGRVISIDKLPICPIEGATVLGSMDFTLPECQEKLRALLNDEKADVVLSDMAPNASGVRHLDHDCIIKLVYAALKFSFQVVKPGGTFLAKVWDGGRCRQVEEDLNKFFQCVKSVRPDATYSDSTEKFFLARGFKGVKAVNTGTT